MDTTEQYLAQLITQFNSWKAQNSGTRIVLRGFYLGRENLKTYGGDRTLLPADGQDQNGAFLLALKNRINSIDPNLSLITSPYQNYYKSGSQLKMYTSYQGRENSIFDGQTQSSADPVVDNAYLQSNVFAPNGKFKDTGDKELIRWTYNYYKDYSKIAFNMETNSLSRHLSTGHIKEYFPEAVSYADYADYLGLHRLPIMYYDGGFSYYDFSVNSSTHWIYEEAYRLAKHARDGHITNGGLEHFALVNPSSFEVGPSSKALSAYHATELLGWNGNFTINHNNGPDISGYSWTTRGSSRPRLGSFHLTPNKWYRLRFNVRENINDGQPWSGIAIWRFLDHNGNQITTGAVGNGIKYSTYVNGWYHYVNSSTTEQDMSLSFQIPAGAVNTELLMGKWRGNASLTWSNVNIQDPVSGLPAYLIGKGSANQFAVRDFSSFGQSANLAKGQYLESENAFNVTADLAYTFSHESQLKPGKNCRSYNGVMGVKFFHQNGAQITGKVSGLNWSSFLGLHYRYFIAKNHQQKHHYDFTAPAGASTAKVQLKNWYCSNNILVDNLSLQDSAHPEDAVSFAGDAMGIDQDNLVRLTQQNKEARAYINLGNGNYTSLHFLSRANCSQFGNSSCQASLELEYIYLDSNGVVLAVDSEKFNLQGEGEFYIKPGNDRFTYTHWHKNQRILSHPQAIALIVVSRRGTSSNVEELLLNRLHVK
jgi:hypothetical protein